MSLGRTGLQAGRIGMAGSYGVAAADVERAFEQGINYLYWGSFRTAKFGEALRNLRPRRDGVILVVQSYTRVASLMSWSLERALRKIGYDRADVLLLGMWNKPVPERLRDAAEALRARGLVRHLAVSTHKRVLAPQFARDFDVVHVRYNAAHPGAERDIFPHLPPQPRAGLVGFTATSWGQLVKRGIPARDCYRFVLARPEIDICLTGPANAQHVDEALEATRLGPLAPEEIDRVRRLAGVPAATAAHP